MRRLLAATLIGAVRGYQLLVSPLFTALGARCGYYPTCSEYAAESVRKLGPLRGSLRAMGRLLRCHPLHPGGIDLP